MTQSQPGDAPATMPAWTQPRYGGPEVVSLDEVPVPAPRATELIVRVRATGIHAGDIRLMRGDPWLVRLAFGIRRPRTAVRGMDVAGTVVALGADVSGFAVGDEVVAELPSGGGLAPYAALPAARAARRPAAVAAHVAAVLPVSGGTAWQALDAAGLGDAAAVGDAAAGRRVLVIGASGGVGTYTVQLARARGAEVWALTGARTIELVTGLGATRAFDYRVVQPGSPELPAGGFDAVIDIAGTAPLVALRNLLREGGSVVLVSGQGGRVLGPLGRMLRAMVLSRRGRRIRPLAAAANPEILATLLSLVTEGAIAPVIERVYPFAQARDALAHVDAGHTVGKVVVTQE